VAIDYFGQLQKHQDFALPLMIAEAPKMNAAGYALGSALVARAYNCE
jgi:hypothetical protein